MQCIQNRQCCEKGALHDLPLVLYQLSQRGDSVGLVAQLAGLSPIYYMILVLLQTMPDDIYTCE